MSATEIREALTEVRDAIEVPAIDRLDFQRRVRGERRRRSAERVLVGAAGAPAATGRLSETVFFVLDGNLTALDPTGTVHDLGLRSEGVVGFTSKRVYAYDDDSHLVVRTVSYDDAGRAVFADALSPVPGAVQSAALSGDGRYLAWTDLDDVTHRYDLEAGRQDLELPGDPDTSLTGVGEDDVLLSENGDLVSRTVGSAIPVPVRGDGYGASSQVAFGHVFVNDRDGRSRLYDIADGTAHLVDTIDGFGVLGPYAERVGVIVPGSADVSRLEVWDGGTSRPVTGLDGTPDQVRWADEVTLLVAAHDGRQGSLYAGDIDLACERLPVEGEVNLNR
jgi:hypothetical protein